MMDKRYRVSELTLEDIREIARHNGSRIIRSREQVGYFIGIEEYRKLKSESKMNQNLFNALYDVCGFTALESDMEEITKAVIKDNHDGKTALETTTEFINSPAMKDYFNERERAEVGNLLFPLIERLMSISKTV